MICNGSRDEYNIYIVTNLEKKIRYKNDRWALVQVLQAVEPSCSNPMVVIYHIAPPSAVVMVPMAVLEVIRKGDIASSRITTTAVVEVAVVIAGAGLFSFMLIFAEVMR